MKNNNLKVLILILGLWAVAGCGKKEEQKLTAFNPEAFAYSLNDGFEVTATVRVKGFKQNIQNNTHLVKLSYTMDLMTPDGRAVNGIVRDTLEEENTDEFSDLPIEAQIQLNNSYKPGNYRLVMQIKDELSERTAKTEKEFEIK